MKHLKTILIIGLMLAILLNFLSASAEEPLTLWGPSHPAEIEIMQEMIKDFESKTGFRVDYVALSGPQSEQLSRFMIATMAGVEDSPDILIGDISMTASLAQEGIIIPLGEFIERITPAPIPDLVEAFRFKDGRRYGVPRQFSTLTLFYNEEIFEETGIQKPNSNWTWTELAKAAEQLNRQASIPGIIVRNDFLGFISLGIANGILERREGLFPAAEALSSYVDWRKNGWIIHADEINVGWEGQAFVNRQAAMVITNSSLIKFIEKTNSNLRYGAVPLPVTESGDHGSLLYADAYLITKRAEERNKVEEAQQLIEFLSQEIQGGWFEAGLWLPPREDLGVGLVEKHPTVSAIYQGVTDAKPDSFAFSKFPVVLDDRINHSIASGGRLSVDQALEVLDQALEAAELKLQ